MVPAGQPRSSPRPLSTSGFAISTVRNLAPVATFLAPIVAVLGTRVPRGCVLQATVQHIRFHHGDHTPTEARIAIEHQVAQVAFLRECFSELLDDPVSDGVLCDIEMQNAPPGMIDQGPKVLADGRTPRATMVLRQPRPVLAEPGPVPADHCLRLYEQKHFGPSHPDSTQGHPEHSVSNSAPWTSAAVDEGG